MGFVGALMGGESEGGGAGMNYNAKGTRIDEGANMVQANQAYSDAQAALQQQKAFMQALQGQNGIQNQSDVYNQLGNIAAGQGPNPAQAMLANSTGANTANQAALMAGQRGSSANAGLIARQAAMQGGANQQNAIGQGAVLQAQQSMNALNAQSGIAGQQVSNLGGATMGYNTAAQNEQGQILNSINAQNNARVAMQSNMNNANAGVSGVTAGQQGALVSNLMSSASSAAMAAEGGMITQQGDLIKPAYADGGQVAGYPGQSMTGSFLFGNPQSPAFMSASNPLIDGSAGHALDQGTSDAGDAMGKGIKGMLKGKQGGEQLPATGGPMASAPTGTMMAAQGGPVVGQKLAEQKKMVPGKAKVKGNSYANDTVDAKLSPGEVVIPRSVMQSKDPIKASADFVAAVLAKQGLPARKKSK